MELRDYIRVVRQRLGTFLAVFAVVIGGYLSVSLTSDERIYHAYCRLVVNPTRVPIQGMETYFPGSARLSMDTRIAGIRSKSVQQMAAERLAEARYPGTQRLLFAAQLKQAEGQRKRLEGEVLAGLREASPGASDADLRQKPEFQQALDARARRALLDLLILEIERSYTVDTLSKGDLVRLHVVSDSPARTAAIANALADASIDFNAKFDRNALAEGREKARKRMANNLKALNGLVDEIKRFREAHNYSDYASTHAHLLGRKAELRRTQDELASQLAWMDRIAQLEAQRAEEEGRLPGLDEAARLEADARIQRLSRQHAELLGKLGPRQPGAPTVLDRLLDRRQALEADRSALASQVAGMAKKREALERRREMVNTQFWEMEIAKDPQLSRLSADRLDQEKRLEAMLTRYTESHPEVKSLLRSLEETRRQHDDLVERFRAQEAREHAYQTALMDLDRTFLQEEVARKDAEIARTEEEVRSLRLQERQTDRKVLELERGFIQDELARKDQGVKEVEKEILRIDQIRFDEQTLLEQQKQLETENSMFSSFLGRANLVDDTEMNPVERFEDALSEGDVWSERSDLYPMLWFVAVIGALASLGVVFLIEYMDTTLRTEHDVRRHLNLPVLAIVPQQAKGQPVLLHKLNPLDPIGERFHSAATLVRSAAKDLNLKAFAVTSTLPEEGKTTVSINLAVALARKGVRVALVDADLRIPQIHALLGLSNARGLSSFLEQEAGEPGSFLQESGIENLRVLTSGPLPKDPVPLLESVRMKALLEELKAGADFILCDTPPISSVGDTLTVASLCDATLFVVGARQADQHGVSWAKHLLTHIEAKVLGCILNKAAVESRSYYYYRYSQKTHREG